MQDGTQEFPPPPGRIGQLMRVVIILLSVITLGALVAHFSDLRRAADVLLSGNLRLVGLALLAQVAAYVAYSAAYQCSFETVGIQARLGWVANTYVQSLLSAIIIPAGTIALFLAALRERGQPTSRAALALLFVRAADLLAYSALFSGLILYLAIREHVDRPELFGIGVTLAVTGTLVALLVLMARRPEGLSRLLTRLSLGITRLFLALNRPSPFPEEAALNLSHQIEESAAAITQNRSNSAHLLLWTLSSHLLDVLTLHLLFLAFHHSVSFDIVLAGFVIGWLFFVIPIAPQGIGVVEGAMIVTYQGSGVPLETAVVVTAAFRALSFWLPAVLGAALLEWRTGRRLLSR